MCLQIFLIKKVFSRVEIIYINLWFIKMLSKLIRSLIRSTICRFPEGNAEAGSVVNEDSGNNEKDQFLYDLMVDFFRLVHASAEDNFDHRRFENDDYIDSSKFYVDRAALFLVGMLERGVDYYNVYRLFTDDKSRFCIGG